MIGNIYNNDNKYCFKKSRVFLHKEDIVMMTNAKKVMFSVIIVMAVYNTVVVTHNKKSVVDVRKFGLEFGHNKQDERKNTFLHKLAFECEGFNDWSQAMQRIEFFMQNNKNWMPNPLVENSDGRTARKEAKESFKRTGNPVCGVFVIYLKQIEYNYFNKMALKSNRDLMAIAQYKELPAG